MRTAAMTQYNVEFPSAPGVQQRLTRLLHKSNVDLKSMVTARVGPKTTVQFLAPKRDALRMNLKRLRVSVREDFLFQFKMPRRQLELEDLTRRLADKGISILSLHSTVKGQNMRIALAVDQPANAAKVIDKLGYVPEPAMYG